MRIFFTSVYLKSIYLNSTEAFIDYILIKKKFKLFTIKNYFFETKIILQSNFYNKFIVVVTAATVILLIFSSVRSLPVTSLAMYMHAAASDTGLLPFIDSILDALFTISSANF
jgi:hypothetical protein